MVDVLTPSQSGPSEQTASAPRNGPVAAVDLGSNSFHLIVAERGPNGQLKVLDRMKDMVRLAAGLDHKRRLDESVVARAEGCLARFGARLRGLAPANVRAVGTNTLRHAKGSRGVIERFEAALGYPIEVISGREEARLIYTGVAFSDETDQPRLVIDIGGGSTELIIGQGFTPMVMESVAVGCVNLTQRHVADGRITEEAMERARLDTLLELRPVQEGLRRHPFQVVQGASGTIRAAASVAEANGWDLRGALTASALARISRALVKAGHVDRVQLSGLSEERASVFAAGVAVLSALFEALDIELMAPASGALREGLLVDLLGRLRREDIRSQSVSALAERWEVDPSHSARVAATALNLFDQVAAAWRLQQRADLRILLDWAARLHEVGLTIAHNRYHKHGAYLLENADIAGFSQRDQRLLAALVRCHRRRFARDVLDELPAADAEAARYLCVVLRLSVLLHRAREDQAPPVVVCRAESDRLDLCFPAGYLREQPLMRADLEQEKDYLKAAGIKLKFDA